jgi:hypothetical protein
MLLPRRSVACLALLASVSGCSGSSEPKVTLYPVVDERGLITYMTEDPYDAAVEKDRRNAELRHEWSQQQAALSRGRQQNVEAMQAEALSRQARQEQFRQEQRDTQAYQDMRRQNERALSSWAQPPPQPSPGYVPSGEAMSARLERESRQHDQLLTLMNWQMQEQAQREARQQGLGQR